LNALALLLFAAPSQGGPPDRTFVIEGFRSASEAAVSASSMRYLPFDVPPGVTRMRVRKEFDHGPDPAQRNTVDFGLFDPRGAGLGGRGFRGWMGGTAGDAVVTGDRATTGPHFLAGPIQPGRWHLAQWFLKASPSGLKYKYTVTLSFDGSTAPRSVPRPPRYEPGTLKAAAAWYAGNLHTHTHHSDGARPLVEVARLNRDAGFDFVASTEHNNVAAHFEFAEVARHVPDLLLLEGDEFTSPFGHANIIGQRPGYWFDFRFDGGENRLPGVVGDAHRQGAIFVVNHPFAMCTTCNWRYPEQEWRDADGIEVWNGAWDFTDESALKWWDGLLRKGHRLNAYGGSDYHRGADPLSPATRVFSRTLSRRDVMRGLRDGATVVVRDPRGPFVELTVDGSRVGSTARQKLGGRVRLRTEGASGLTLVLISDEGVISSDTVVDESPIERPIDLRGRRFVRAELRQGGIKGTMVALTNAVFIR